jgi:hypothetical protein
MPAGTGGRWTFLSKCGVQAAVAADMQYIVLDCAGCEGLTSHE